MAKKVIRPLRSEADYDAALSEIERYFDKEPVPGTPEADRFDLLALVIEDYERKHWLIDPPDTIDAIHYRMETSGYTQSDLGRLLGSRQRASDILNRKRPLTMGMAWKLHREWGIPAEALITPPRQRRRRAPYPQRAPHRPLPAALFARVGRGESPRVRAASASPQRAERIAQHI